MRTLICLPLVVITLSLAAADNDDRIIDLSGGWDFRIEHQASPEAGAQLDEGISAAAADWHLDAGDSGWSSQALPGNWERFSAIGDIDGAVWFRRSVELSEEQAEQDWDLGLGGISQFDVTWVNGTKVGSTGRETPKYWRARRNYTVPASVLVPGTNEIVVRNFNWSDRGGFVSGERHMRLQHGDTAIPLAGTWHFRIERAIPEYQREEGRLEDTGISNEAANWPVKAEGTWLPIELPNTFTSWKGTDVSGAAWYRRVVSIPEEATEALVFRAGTVVGDLQVWWDGTPVSQRDDGCWMLPAETVTEGEHRLTLRLLDRSTDLAGIMDDAGGFLIAAERAYLNRIMRGPYLQRVSPTAVTVSWRTLLPQQGFVTLGDQRFEGDAGQVDHEVRISGLKPDSEYTYAVGEMGTPYTFRTAPEAGSERPFRTWIIGDSGTANSNARAVFDAYRNFTGDRYTDLWLMLGDNAYNDGTDDEYQLAVFDMYPELLPVTPLFSTLGNHDGHSAKSADESGPYYQIFDLPREGECGGLASGTEAYYSFDYGNVHFVCLDSYGTDRSTAGAMYAWLKADLEANLQPWLIAFWHHPPYTKGSHDSDKESDLTEMRENFLPLLEQHGVDLCFTGHSHSYERSYLIDGHYGKSDTFDPKQHRKDRGDGNPEGDGAYRKASGGNNGATYVVAGSSGKAVSKGSHDHPAMLRSMKVLGSVVMDVSGLRCELRFLGHKGEILDHWVIDKSQEQAEE